MGFCQNVDSGYISGSKSIAIGSSALSEDVNNDPAYLLVYKDIGLRLIGDNYGTGMVREERLFDDFQSLDDFLNSSYSYNEGAIKKSVRLKKQDIVGIWDLKNLNKLDFEFHSEIKKTERKVVIDADEWVDEFITIKNNQK